ncbi:NAD(P)H-binding protein [Congregibacter brevis]|uniref:NAD(P)H-binding protein n=1 Tax=Congregibacter brevis TaxID=3081201 RepID=A0ABZ0IGA3_9GAMM|nr:NAD(P)H-binding protein [Congregibacter sp. IMCC45268]
MKDLLLAGATGLVGQAVLKAYDEGQFHVTTVGRRATGQVSNEVLTDFLSAPVLPASDVAICALGTTIASAGSKEAFRAVDYDAVLSFAKAAKAANVSHFILVSSAGSNPKAGVFYARVKGEVERDLAAIGFRRLDIAQPGLLLGNRSESRPIETIMRRTDPLTRLFLKGPLDRYAGIEVTTVGAALLALCSRQEDGIYRHENRALLKLADVGPC